MKINNKKNLTDWLSVENAYLLGLIFSDGCLYTYPNGIKSKLSIAISAKDEVFVSAYKIHRKPYIKHRNIFKFLDYTKIIKQSYKFFLIL